ncbi:sensor histidine kinase [Turneriella parva]|uniref:histidine kinase n=1 Tax=Turneriella parva (strain ATCC BAA-1111 / DSM 21527 / NCTC 11395 / H) TaxID=869212 RepID=I4BBV4_TURPD|nr:HAMP domain-containing sensor histidine kinase [Turneriella parva]AFM14761.1 integral membrane sensor signal transduction histidine kinase [Turneriella parva DSM 21527]
MPRTAKNTITRISLFSGWTLLMALSLMAVVVLLVWWQRLLSHNLEVQYGYIESQLKNNKTATAEFYELVLAQDEKLASRYFIPGKPIRVKPGAADFAAERLKNRQRMVLYEQLFFIVLLLSGQLFFLYIFARERLQRKQVEETILLATHELRQPLQSLSLALETLKPRAKAKTLAAIETGLSEISKLAQHIRFLAETFSTGAGARKTQVDDLDDYITRVCTADFAPEQITRIRRDVATAQNFTIGMSDPLFHFVVRNLLENALKYGSGPIEITAAVAAKRLVINVRSKGAPIPAQEFEKLGRIFQRSGSTLVQNTPGFGLGLYLCGRIVRRASGKLQLSQSAEGIVTARLELKII